MPILFTVFRVIFLSVLASSGLIFTNSSEAKIRPSCIVLKPQVQDGIVIGNEEITGAFLIRIPADRSDWGRIMQGMLENPEQFDIVNLQQILRYDVLTRPLNMRDVFIFGHRATERMQAFDDLVDGSGLCIIEPGFFVTDLMKTGQWRTEEIFPDESTHETLWMAIKRAIYQALLIVATALGISVNALLGIMLLIIVVFGICAFYVWRRRQRPPKKPTQEELTVRAILQKISAGEQLPYDPLLTFTSPQPHGIAFGLLQVSVDIADQASVDHVNFYIEHKVVRVIRAAPFSFTASTKEYANGSEHHVIAVAFNRRGDVVGEAMVEFTVDNHTKMNGGK